MIRSAVVSPDQRYRYVLGRSWDPVLPVVLWVMLNPSKADAEIDDPTVVRCVGFAQLWGFGGIRVVNMYAYRATDQRELWPMSRAARVGPENDAWIRAMVGVANAEGSPVIAAWGAHNRDRERRRELVRMLDVGRLSCLGFNADGSPRHPLMLRADTPLEPWREAA